MGNVNLGLKSQAVFLCRFAARDSASGRVEVFVLRLRGRTCK